MRDIVVTIDKTVVVEATKLQLLFESNEWEVITNGYSQYFINKLESNSASITQEAIARSNADEALAQSITSLNSTVNDNKASAELSISTLTTSTQAIASRTTELEASTGDLNIRLTSSETVVAGYFSVWDGLSTPKIGQTQIVGDTIYQYLGGTLGENGDGWLRTDKSAQDTANTVKGWVAGASSLVVDPETKTVTGWQYGNGSGFDSVFKISADNIELEGTTTFTNYKNSNISLSSDGTLNGAGGGQVTVSGIGAETPDGSQTKADTAEQNAKDYSDATFVTTTLHQADINNIQNQIDKNITSWFDDGAPTLDNLPASDWSSDSDKDVHLGDLYYDGETGYAYRFKKDSSANYLWSRISDTDITTALANAQKAQDTADGKRRVFVSTPVVPYDVGDLWDAGGVIKRCATAKGTDGSYAAEDWVYFANYSTGSLANKDSVGVDDLDPTVIVNGLLKTDLLSATNIKTGALETERLLLDGVVVVIDSNGKLNIGNNSITNVYTGTLMTPTLEPDGNGEINYTDYIISSFTTSSTSKISVTLNIDASLYAAEGGDGDVSMDATFKLLINGTVVDSFSSSVLGATVRNNTTLVGNAVATGTTSKLELQITASATAGNASVNATVKALTIVMER